MTAHSRLHRRRAGRAALDRLQGKGTALPCPRPWAIGQTFTQGHDEPRAHTAALHHHAERRSHKGWRRRGYRAAPETFLADGYHSRMRRVLSFALVVLLVLRGLLGTAMAEGLAPVQPAKAAHVAQGALQAGQSLQTPAMAAHFTPGHAMSGHTVHADGAAPVDAESRANASACDGVASSACHHEHSASCPDCDICHSAMLALPAMPTRSLRVTGAVRPANAVPFASVPAARTIKPPIA